MLTFELKKINTSGLSYKNDGQIPIGKIENNKIINSNITFTKPYKIQIRASKMIDGKRSQIKKIMTFESTTTLLDAIKQASKIYENLMNDLGISKFIKQDFSSSMSYEKVFDMYLNYKESQYESRDDKKPFDRKSTQNFHSNWLKTIMEKAIGTIDEEDLQKIITKMKKQGLSERTSRKVFEFVNPVFKYFNMKASKFGINLASPALKRDLPPLRNERGLDISLNEIKELFNKLKNYPITPIREIYMFLMHGRRFGEVVSLDWRDIDFQKNIYTIRAINNKARIDMIYHLSDRLKESLELIGKKENGYIFHQINDINKPYSESSIRTYWKKKPKNEEIKKDVDYKPIVIHQIRNCIATYLKNKMGIGDDVAGAILGHKQNKTITSRYGKINYITFGKILDAMLNDIFDEKIEKNVDFKKLEKLRILFPDKTEKQLLEVLEILD